MELLKCHHGDCPRDISIQVLQQENKYIAGLGQGLEGAEEGAGPSWPWGQEDWTPQHPLPQLPHLSTGSRYSAGCLVRVMLLMKPAGLSLTESPWSCPSVQGMAWAHVAGSQLTHLPCCWISIPGTQSIL